nr:uncharacterized protein LOC111991905 [Quercus suber]
MRNLWGRGKELTAAVKGESVRLTKSSRYKLCQHVLDPNFDAAFFEKSGSAGVGVVYRDHTGQIIGALRQNIGSVQSIKMAEALAARRAVLFAKELSLFRVIIEGDCTRVIDALKGSGLCRTLNGQVIDETKSLGGMLRGRMFQHQRERNRLTHSLAKNAVLFADTDV